MESLKTIAATGTIRVPHPLALVDDPEGRGSMLVTEYLDLKSVGSKDCELGTNVARQDVKREVILGLYELSEFLGCTYTI